VRSGQKRPRVLIYSHDSFGLGHLRRCRAIAHALTARYPQASVLILSGSPIIGRFDFGDRVDFVRIPGVIKKRGGAYTSLSLPLAVEETMALREDIIRHTTEAFAPDLVIVDKEPLGLRGEMAATLSAARDAGVRLVLGLRDILDDPQLLIPEWRRKAAIPALDLLYDEVWIFGLQEIFNPLAGLDLPSSVKRKLKYTGYLRRNGAPAPAPPDPSLPHSPFILVTTGGGGDGDGLVDWVLRAYERKPSLPFEAVIVLGPFMDVQRRKVFEERAAAVRRVHTRVFDAHMERLMGEALGVVAMGGYNTFCEILSHDKPAVLVPRLRPRREQLIRAVRAEQLGLVRMLVDPLDARGEMRDPAIMAEALLALPHQQRPSVAFRPGLLDGLDVIADLAAPALGGGAARRG
jgi:predicted glycosyltransferase